MNSEKIGGFMKTDIQDLHNKNLERAIALGSYEDNKEEWDELEEALSKSSAQLFFQDALVDRDCVLLDGWCKCPRPVFDHCKHIVQTNQEVTTGLPEENSSGTDSVEDS